MATKTATRPRSTTSSGRREQQRSKTRHPASRPRPAAVPGRFVALLAIVVVLNLIGLVMVLSASSVSALHDYGSSWTFFNRQAIWTALGFAAMFVTLRVDFHIWRKLTPLALLVGFALLVVVLMPGVGLTVNGSRSWLGHGAWRLQPAELMKLALLLYTADLLARRADRMGDVKATLWPVLIVLGATGGLLMLQPDLGTAIVTVAIVMGMLFIAGTPLAPLGLATAVMAGAATFLTMSAPYRRARLLSFLHPSDDPLNRGWQTLQSLVGVASGGIAGVGLGASRAKWGFLPEAHTDFIFAIIGEELGFVGCFVVVALFFTFGILGLQAARRAPDRYGMLVAAGVTVWVLVQAIVNMGAVVGLLPITGLPLPFVSFGGSALITTMAANGLLLNIARQGSAARSRAR
jgi:cell division protein FtsW